MDDAIAYSTMHVRPSAGWSRSRCARSKYGDFPQSQCASPPEAAHTIALNERFKAQGACRNAARDYENGTDGEISEPCHLDRALQRATTKPCHAARECSRVGKPLLPGAEQRGHVRNGSLRQSPDGGMIQGWSHMPRTRRLNGEVPFVEIKQVGANRVRSSRLCATRRLGSAISAS